MKTITLYTLGILLYINYRIIYAFMWHKPVLSFSQYAKSKQSDNTIPLIVTTDLTILFLYLFGVWWTLGIWIVAFVLNYLVYFVYSLFKRLWNTRSTK